MLIGELADRTGVTPKTLRFYECEQLLPNPNAPPAATATTSPTPSTGSPSSVKRKRPGSPSPRSDRLAIRDDGQAPCSHAAQLIDQQLEDVERRLTELQATRDQLRQLANRARRLDPDDCIDICHIIQPDRPSKP